MIIEDTKVENKLRPKGYVYIKFIYEDKKEIQGDVDPLTINYPMIKNNDWKRNLLILSLIINLIFRVV